MVKLEAAWVNAMCQARSGAVSWGTCRALEVPHEFETRSYTLCIPQKSYSMSQMHIGDGASGTCSRTLDAGLHRTSAASALVGGMQDRSGSVPSSGR